MDISYKNLDILLTGGYREGQSGQTLVKKGGNTGDL